ncbi:LANO_0G16886g1_1 [Lachancea nothofagi CBS 11611]|uniref:LANO_0G16886g1_1 n=1 Tax=Lachancea nothofagi CBS 11611 TaxID=1266666 RepID=A0A1G4KKM7_9SACH|nr:LANO_0G16886g1_1 [Lachancea nothofagi CBS 11611]
MEEVVDTGLKRDAVKHRLRERTGSIFKSRQETGLGRQKGVSHDQILISSSPTSLVQIAKSLEGDILSVSKHRTVDNVLILGATGLTGGTIVAQLAQPWIYLNSTDEIQRKVNNLYPPNEKFERSEKSHNFLKRSKSPLCNVLTRKKTVEVVKNLFCFTRKPLEIGNVAPFEKLDAAWEHTVVYKGSSLVCKCDNFLCDEHLVSVGYLELPNKSQENFGTAIDIQIQQYTYHLTYENSQDAHGESCRHSLTVDLKINVVSLIEKDSSKWPESLRTLFREEPTAASVVTKKLEQTIVWNFPPLRQVGTIISAMGSTSFQERKTKISRRFVDYELNMLMVQIFSESKMHGIEKKAVVITSFNNLFLSSTSEYFNTKLNLEQDLATNVPGLDKLVILRPGPLVGSHTHTVANPDSQSVKPSFVPTTVFNIYRFKKSCVEHKLKFIKDVSNFGVRLKLSEICARLAYQRSCSPLLGYVVPAYKVAYAAAVRSIYSPDRASFVELIKSDQIEKMV